MRASALVTQLLESPSAIFSPPCRTKDATKELERRMLGSSDSRAEAPNTTTPEEKVAVPPQAQEAGSVQWNEMVWDPNPKPNPT